MACFVSSDKFVTPTWASVADCFCKEAAMPRNVNIDEYCSWSGDAVVVEDGWEEVVDAVAVCWMDCCFARALVV